MREESILREKKKLMGDVERRGVFLLNQNPRVPHTPF